MPRIRVVNPESPAGAPALAALRRRSERFVPLLVDFLAELNARNAGFDWWAFSLASKNPLSSPLPRRAFWLWRAREEGRALGPDGVLEIPTDDAVLAGALSALCAREGWAFESNATFARPSLKQRAIMLAPVGPVTGLLRALGRRRDALRLCPTPGPGPRYAAVYSNIRPDSFDPAGNYRDVFFGELLPEIRRRGLTPLVFGEVIGGDATLRLCAAHRAFPIVALEHFADGPRLSATLRRALKARLGGFPVHGPFLLDGLDIESLVQEDLAQNLRESRYFNDLLFYAGAAGLFSRLPVELFFLPYENMARDRMLLSAARDAAPRMKVIGYQHTGITPQHLNFRLGRAELASLPLPDSVVAMSEATKELLADWGFPKKKLAVGCALRQAASAPPRAPRPAAAPPRLLVLLATSVAEAESLLEALDCAFKDRPGSAEALVRAHPAMPRVAALVSARGLKPPFRNGTGRPIEEAWAWADAVVYASSTLGIESVHRGIPAIFFDLGGFLSVDPAFMLDDLKWTVSDGDGLRAAAAEIAALTPESIRPARERGRRFTERYLRMPSPESLAAFFQDDKTKPVAR